MKVQSKFILMSTAALFAIISSASAVEVPGLREVNGIRVDLDRKFRKLNKTQEQLLIEELYNDRPSAYDDRKDRKEAKTFEEVRALCEKLKAAIETHGLVSYAKKECGRTQPNNLPAVESEVQVAETTPAPPSEDRTNIITINGVDYIVEMNAFGGNGTGGQGTGGQGTGGQGSGNQGSTTTVSTEIPVTGTGGQGDQGNNPGNNPGPNEPVTPVDPVVVQPPVTPPPVTPVVRKTPVKTAKKKKAVKKTTRIVSEPAKKKPAKRIVSEPKKTPQRPPVKSIQANLAPMVVHKPTLPSVDSILHINVAPAAPEKLVTVKKLVAQDKKKSSSVMVVEGAEGAADMKAKSNKKSKRREKLKNAQMPESIKDILLAKQAKGTLSSEDISNVKAKNFGAIRAQADSVHMKLTRSSSAVSAN